MNHSYLSQQHNRSVLFYCFWLIKKKENNLYIIKSQENVNFRDIKRRNMNWGRERAVCTRNPEMAFHREMGTTPSSSKRFWRARKASWDARGDRAAGPTLRGSPGHRPRQDREAGSSSYRGSGTPTRPPPSIPLRSRLPRSRVVVVGRPRAGSKLWAKVAWIISDPTDFVSETIHIHK